MQNVYSILYNNKIQIQNTKLKFNYSPFIVRKRKSRCGWYLCIIRYSVFICCCYSSGLSPYTTGRINPYTICIQRQCRKLSYGSDCVISYSNLRAIKEKEKKIIWWNKTENLISHTYNIQYYMPLDIYSITYERRRTNGL